MSCIEFIELNKEPAEPASVNIKIKRTFPIAPDGFIPNSVVKKFFKIFEPSRKSEKKVWKLKWKPPELYEEEQQQQQEKNEFKSRDFFLDLTSDEEKEQDELAKQENAENLFKDLIKNLKALEWFKLQNEISDVETIVRYLVNKLSERDSNSHDDIYKYLIYIKKNFRLSPNLLAWIRTQLEEELDATDPNILLNNIHLISEFCSETYKIDSNLIEIINNQNNSSDIIQTATNCLNNICDLSEPQINFVIQNLKRFQNPKYKKLDKFKLKKFVQELEIEYEENLRKKEIKQTLVEDETNSETFKLLQREDWIPEAIKQNLKTLKDYLNYLLKSLKTVKSKIFYEKICSYLKTLYDEFKLYNSQWEKEIISSLINNNIESKVPEHLRLIDIENLSKYFSNLGNDIKQDILSELLRSAVYEKLRPNVMQISKDLLKKLSGLSQADLDALIKFTNSKNFKMNWSEALNYYKTRPDITLEELREIKGSNVSLIEEKISKKTTSMKISKKKSKKKNANKKQEEKKEKTVKKKQIIEKNNVIENRQYGTNLIVEKTEPIIDVNKNAENSNKLDKKFTELKSEEKKQENENFKITQDFAEITEIIPLVSNDKNNKEARPLTRGKSNLLPNSSKSWDYYQKRNELEKERSNLSIKEDLSKLNDKNNLIKIEKTKTETEFENIEIYSSSESDQDEETQNNLELKQETSTNDLLENKVENNQPDEYLNSKTKKTSKEILEGITKRVIINEIPSPRASFLNKNNPEFIKRFNTIASDTSNEKAHFIEPIDLKNNLDSNIRFRSMQQNKRIRLIETNQLLECLIIRGLELHKHYEKLLPSPSLIRKTETFIPISYYNDFLVVHPYNSKNSLRQFTSVDLKKPVDDANENLNFPNPVSSNNNLYPVRKLRKRNTWKNNNEAKIGDFELNHIFLINKLLISYEAQNMRHLYTTLNSSFKNYLNKLHSRIPNKIIPLIWNDPVIQKLALVISSSEHFKNRPKFEMGETVENRKHIFDSSNIQDIFKNYEKKKFSNMKNNNEPYQNINKEVFASWPVFKGDDSPKNKVIKKKLYQHIMGVKHDCIKLQWRYMLHEDKIQKPQKSFLPPISFKAPLNYTEN